MGMALRVNSRIHANEWLATSPVSRNTSKRSAIVIVQASEGRSTSDSGGRSSGEEACSPKSMGSENSKRRQFLGPVFLKQLKPVRAGASLCCLTQASPIDRRVRERPALVSDSTQCEVGGSCHAAGPTRHSDNSPSAERPTRCSSQASSQLPCVTTRPSPRRSPRQGGAGVWERGRVNRCDCQARMVSRRHKAGRRQGAPHPAIEGSLPSTVVRART